MPSWACWGCTSSSSGMLGFFTDDFTTGKHLARVDLFSSKLTSWHWVSGLKDTHRKHVALSVKPSEDDLFTLAPRGITVKHYFVVYLSMYLLFITFKNRNKRNCALGEAPGLLGPLELCVWGSRQGWRGQVLGVANGLREARTKAQRDDLTPVTKLQAGPLWGCLSLVAAFVTIA